MFLIERLQRLLTMLSGSEFFLGLLWLGLMILTVALLVMMWTRWGQSRLLQKCLFLSVLAHTLLCGYSATILPPGSPRPGPAPEAVIRVSIAEPPHKAAWPDGPQAPAANARAAGAAASIKPWESFGEDWVVPTEAKPLARAALPDAPEVRRRSPKETAALPIETPHEHLPLVKSAPIEPGKIKVLAQPPAIAKAASAEPIAAPKAQRHEAKEPVVPPRGGLERSLAADARGPIASRTPLAAGDLPRELFEQRPPVPRLDAAFPAPAPPPMDLEHAPLKPLARLNPRGPAKPPASDPAAADLKPRNPQDYGGIDSEEPPAMRQSVLGLSVNKRSADESEESPGGGISLGAPPLSRPGEKHDVPAVYKLRVAPDRVQVAQRYGATPETEAAVQAALKWVSEAQASDGRWSARQHGGGLELKTDGRDRLGAGLEADTGMTGLALLALLASGHTHRDGLYHQNVQHGLEFLLRSQTREGNLGGAGSVYERMYCHGIAAFALSEALGMTSDERLRDPVRRALAFTVAAQNPKTGGWRYQPGDPGDTSQLGWQYMALKSGELAGIPIADSTREGIFKFLQSVATGRAGGLALYRALPKERPTRVMSAEAIACWQLLGMSRDHPAGREAADFIVEELPGGGPNNVYYWYYGTLALYQLQGEPWARWNEALRSTLLASQRKDGPLAGSWDPDAVWGGYGGRVYSTAISALCLEVYYRFLPLYRQASMPAASPAGKGER